MEKRAVGPNIPDIFIREQVNLEVVVLGAFIAGYCLLYLYNQVTRNPHWYDDFGVKGALALMCFFGGEGIARAWAYFLLRVTRVEGPQSALLIESYFPFAIIGGILVFIGGLCMIRVFTITYGQWPWATAAIAVITALIMNWLH